MVIFKIFSILFLAIIAMTVFVVASVVGGIWSLLGGHGSRRSGPRTRSENRGGDTVTNGKATRKRKIIPHDEGEYVDFEEIK